MANWLRWRGAVSLVKAKILRAVGIATSSLSRFQFCRDLFFHVARGYTSSIEASVSGGPRYLVRTSDRIVGRTVYLKGDYDGDVLAEILQVTRRIGLGEFVGKTFLDIGANIGTTSIDVIIKSHFSRAIAFEPDPENSRILAANVALNGLQDRITVHGMALSDVEGIVQFETCNENSGDNRVRPSQVLDSGMLDESKRPVIQVRATTFDIAVANGLVDLSQVGLVWIDTQGHEGHVLQGARESLLRSRVPILLEYWPYALRRVSGLELFERLVAENFREVVDIRRSHGDSLCRLPVTEIQSLRDHYSTTLAFTDLLLLK